MKTNVLNYKIVPAAEASSEALARFYDHFFSSRHFALKTTWQWQNRSKYMYNKTPLVMLDGERVIAHAGIIPFQLRLGEVNYAASWYIDFMVDEEYRRKGLGLKITKAFTELSDIYFAVTGNEKSMGAFRKLGWQESEDSFIHYIPLMPFNHPKLSKKIPGRLGSALNSVSYPILYWILAKYRNPTNSKVSPITEQILNELGETNFPTNRWTPVRDIQYWKWRLLESPDATTYACFKSETQSILFKTQFIGNIKTMEILFIPSDLEDEEKLHLIGQLSFWALKHSYSYVRLYTTIPSLSDKIKSHLKSFTTRPEFAYKATDPELFQKLQKTPNWDFQFVDNDFEIL